MAVKHNYYTDKSPKEMKEAWQESTRKRYNNPAKIEAREGRDRALGLNKTENWRRREEGNTYSDKQWREENAAGNAPRKKTTEQILRDAFKNKKSPQQLLKEKQRKEKW